MDLRAGLCLPAIYHIMIETQSAIAVIFPRIWHLCPQQKGTIYSFHEDVLRLNASTSPERLFPSLGCMPVPPANVRYTDASSRLPQQLELLLLLLLLFIVSTVNIFCHSESFFSLSRLLSFFHVLSASLHIVLFRIIVAFVITYYTGIIR